MGWRETVERRDKDKTDQTNGGMTKINGGIENSHEERT